MDEESNTYSVGIVAFLAGACFGAGAALLLAPQSGAETRDFFRGFAGQAKDEMYKRGRAAKDTLDTALERGKESYENVKKQGREALETGKETMRAAQGTAGHRG